MLTRNTVPDKVIIRSCNGVTIKKVNNMPPAPKYCMIWAGRFAGIFFEKLMKNIAKLKARKIIPASAQILDGLSAPFTAFAWKRLLIKFFVQLKPTEFLSKRDPPGYTIVAITSRDTEIIIPSRTEYFFSIQYFYKYD